MNYMTDRKK